ncbi:flagellar protein FlbD [Criibacterium bergeronii]|uniref:Flagellar protein FlbD n=1 Tax=Criibacterium bergeronii TaxID=1871336 RepID=A0A552VDU1_9FIRM|nr:flagellar FlbD family protein [Criibacterium bergeronii]TRW28643.1 flagellar protein FlbD [Criibacterium bergeronii]
MIKLTRLNGSSFLLNSDLIEIVDSTPDTVITLYNEHKYLVRESAEDIVKLVTEFRQKIGSQLIVRKREGEY